MKKLLSSAVRTSLAAAVALTFVCLPQAIAQPKNVMVPKPQVKAEKPKPAQTRKVQVTGSRIPRTVRVAEKTTPDTEMSLAIIREEQLRSAGSGNLKEALKKQPNIR